MNKLPQGLLAIFLFLLALGLLPHLYDDLKNDNHSKASKFASTISTMSILKVVVLEFYSYNGKWPENLGDLGMDQREFLDEAYIDALSVKDGIIYANIQSEFGKGSVARLRPEESMGGINIRWFCETNLKFTQVNYCSYIPDISYPTQ